MGKLLDRFDFEPKTQLDNSESLGSLELPEEEPEFQTIVKHIMDSMPANDPPSLEELQKNMTVLPLGTGSCIPGGI